MLFSYGGQTNNDGVAGTTSTGSSVVDLTQEVHLTQHKPPTEMLDFADWESFFE